MSKSWHDHNPGKKSDQNGSLDLLRDPTSPARCNVVSASEPRASVPPNLPVFHSSPDPSEIDIGISAGASPGESFCQECLRQWTITKLEDGAQRPRCPAGCGKKIDYRLPQTSKVRASEAGGTVRRRN